MGAILGTLLHVLCTLAKRSFTLQLSSGSHKPPASHL
jgi:hypothetical protein